MRRESREKVFQTLFMMDVLGVGPDEAIPLFALIAPAPPVTTPTFRKGVFACQAGVCGLLLQRKCAIDARERR